MTTPKTFKCFSCDKSYRWKCDLKRHQMLKHKDNYIMQTPMDNSIMELTEDADYAFQHPFTMTISGPTGLGKTFFIRKVLENYKINPIPQRIIYLYKRWQPLYDTLKLNVKPKIEFIRGIPEDLDADSFFHTDNNNVIVLDDMMDIAGNNKAVSDLFTEGSHHRNLSVINLTQSLFPKGKNSVTQRRNTQYLVIFKSPMSQDQIAQLGRFMFPSKLDTFLSVYRKATLPAFGYLIIDGKVNTPISQRLVTNIFTPSVDKQHGSGIPVQSQNFIDKQKQTPQSEMAYPNQSLPPPPGIPNTEQVGRGINAITPTDSFTEAEDSESDMDVSNTIPCRYCGILFDDWDSLQKHLMYGCVYDKNGNEEVPPKPAQNKKQKLEDAFDEDLENDLVFTKLFEDAKEMLRDEWEEIRNQYIADGTTEKESARKAHAKMLEKYKQDFFSQYKQLLESMFNLQKNGVHNLILEEINELVGKHRNVEKIIRWVLAKNKFMFEDLFSQEDDDDDSEDADTTDTQSESNEAESEASDFESEDNISGADQDAYNNTSQSEAVFSF